MPFPSACVNGCQSVRSNDHALDHAFEPGDVYHWRHAAHDGRRTLVDFVRLLGTRSYQLLDLLGGLYAADVFRCLVDRQPQRNGRKKIMRRAVNIAALTLLVLGVWMLIRFRPSNMGGEAGVAFIQNADGSVRLATETRPEERTMPVATDVHADKVEADAAIPHASSNSDAKPTQSKTTTKAAHGRYKPNGSDKPWLTEFDLIERSGKRFSSESLKGQPYVVGFFFATCPSICVRQNENSRFFKTSFAVRPSAL